MNNPQQMLNMILNNSQAMQNPIFANAVNLYKQNDVQGLQQIAQNLCKSKGISIDDVKRQIGL